MLQNSGSRLLKFHSNVMHRSHAEFELILRIQRKCNSCRTRLEKFVCVKKSTAPINWRFIFRICGGK